jgi:heme-degrading monooxygenase HmoA
MQDPRDAGSTRQKELVHVATFLPLRRWWYIVPFLRTTSKVLKQVKGTQGVVRYAVKGDFPKRHFWTFSIWEDQDSLRRFVMTEPHATAVRKFNKWAGEGAAFVEWSSSDDIVDWTEAIERLKRPTFYYNEK